MIYDNNCFFSVAGDGTKVLPVRGVDNRYHVDGKLEVADHATVKLLVNTSTPLLRAGGDSEKIILSPLPRYILPCCGDESHVNNRKENSFKVAMSEGLGEIRRSLKDLIFGKKIRNFKVLDPMLLLDSDNNDVGDWARESKKLWQSDPVHLTPGGYVALMEGLMKIYADLDFNRANTSGGGGDGASNTRPTTNRQSWVTEDDTTAHRNQRGGRSRGSQRGGRGGGRGGGGRGGGGRGGDRGGRGHSHKWPKRGGYSHGRGYKKSANWPY
jgi:hypothetical protein